MAMIELIAWQNLYDCPYEAVQRPPVSSPLFMYQFILEFSMPAVYGVEEIARIKFDLPAE
jgi:hypothetical protein